MRIASCLFVTAALLGCQAPPASQTAAIEQVEKQDKPRLGLFTSLPIYWGEAGDIAAMLNSNAEPDWVRSALEEDFRLVPLDTLEADALDDLDRVLLAQPRPLAPSENVALDAFLARGGKAVIMADPMLTRHSDLPFGDKRRPQDVVVLSPILARLGVRLEYDSEQPEGERSVSIGTLSVPVNQAGRFVAVPSDVSPDGCTIEDAAALTATCPRGEGVAYLYADAALLDWEGAPDAAPESRLATLEMLLAPLRAANRR